MLFDRPNSTRSLIGFYLEDSLLLLLNKENIFHVAVDFYSNRAHKTSKYNKNISDTLWYW